ncbi:phage tail terminator family protein [Secundilactobacillus muriivasis]
MNIIDQIGAVLQSLFPDLPIYKEDQKGGFKEPSFFVSSIGTGATPELFERQKRTYSYQLVYFPTLDKPKADMERMQDLLLDNFTVLPEFATIRNREFQVVDGALTGTFDVVIRAYPKDNTPKQETIDISAKMNSEEVHYGKRK